MTSATWQPLARRYASTVIIRLGATALTIAMALAGCDLLAPEEIALTRLTVPRCVTTFPRFPTAEFFSYRNENSDTWISPARNLPDSTFTINATPRVTLAWSGPSRWNVLHTTVQELRQVECSTPDVSNVTHPTFNGSVQNWRADEQLAISLGNWYTYSNPNLNPNFTPTFTATPQLSPFDVLAYATSASSQRIIARRGLTPPAGSTIPPLDFASSERSR